MKHSFSLLTAVFLCFSVQLVSQAQEEQDSINEEMDFVEDVYIDDFPHQNFQYDSSEVEKRSFDKSQLDELASSEEFDYIKDQTQTYSLLDQVKYWIYEMLEKLFYSNENRTGIRYFLYGVAAVVVCFVLMKLMGIETSQLLYRKGKTSKIGSKELFEDLGGINFPEAIQEALQQNDYRMAVRFLYLYMLKQLDEKSLIEWQENKTNHELELELKRPQLKKDFEKATFLFERFYYGAFKVERKEYEKAKVTFDDIDQKLSTIQPV